MIKYKTPGKRMSGNLGQSVTEILRKIYRLQRDNLTSKTNQRVAQPIEQTLVVKTVLKTFL